MIDNSIFNTFDHRFEKTLSYKNDFMTYLEEAFGDMFIYAGQEKHFSRVHSKA